MKKLILMAIATLVVSTAWAQNEKGTFSIKPMAGINVTKQNHKRVMRPRSRIQTTGPNNGHQLRDYSKSSNRSAGQQLYTKAKEKGKLHSDYINLPLMANIYIPAVRGLAVKVGAQIGLLVNDRLEVEVETATIPIPDRPSEGLELADGEPPIYTWSSNSISDICKSVDFGIPVGLSYEYKNVTLDARYYFGLTKVDKTKDPPKTPNQCATAICLLP